MGLGCARPRAPADQADPTPAVLVEIGRDLRRARAVVAGNLIEGIRRDGAVHQHDGTGFADARQERQRRIHGRGDDDAVHRCRGQRAHGVFC